MEFLPTTKVKHGYRKLGAKVAKLVGETTPNDYTPIVDPKDVIDAMGLNFTSDLIGTSHYDIANGYFVGKRSLGFTLEINPITGVNNSLLDDLTVIFRKLPDHSNVQCMLMADHRIGEYLDTWESSGKTTNEFLMKLNSYLVKGLKDIRLEDESPLRMFRVILSFSIPFDKRSLFQKISGSFEQSSYKREAELLQKQKSKIIKMLKQKKFEIKELYSSELLTLFYDILHPTDSEYSHNMKANCFESIADQMGRLGGQLRVEKDGLVHTLGKSKWKIQSFSPSKWPDTWSQGQNLDLIGNATNSDELLSCPFIIQLAFNVKPRDFSTKVAGWKGKWVITQSKVPALHKVIEGLQREADEWDHANQCMLSGDKFVNIGYTVILFSKIDEAEDNAEKLETIYRNNRWELRRDDHLHLPSLLQVLPMHWSEGWYSNMANFKRTKLSLTTEIANFIPLQAEYQGNGLRGVLFSGRRGQIFNHSHFATSTNMNAVVVGTPGSGKSFFMQGDMMSTLSRGGRVFVFDIGESFKLVAASMAEGAGNDAEYVSFAGGKLCINPFSDVCDDPSKFENQAEFIDHMETEIILLTSIMAEMAAPKKGLDDYQNSILMQAVNDTWDKFKQDGSPAKVAELLLESDDQDYKKLGTMLWPFAKGPYSKYFNGKANVTFKKQLSVIELQNLSSRPDLQAVVLKILMQQISNQMMGDERGLFQIVMDECWELLKGNQTQDFIEGLTRKIRKYGGCTTFGSQVITDFINDDGNKAGAQAALACTETVYVLEQSEQAINAMRNSKLFEIKEEEAPIYRSIETKEGVYSEMLIKNSKGMAIGRFRADPFSKVLFSSKAEDVNAVKFYTDKGMPTEQAVDQVLRDRGEGV